MSYTARNIASRLVLSAGTVAASPEFHGAEWECEDCRVPMLAIAADGGDYRVLPHFRVAPGHVHEWNCDADGTLEPIQPAAADGRAQQGREEVAIPNRLRLVNVRPRVVQPVDRLQGEARNVRDRGRGAPPRNIAGDATSSSLRRIVDTYIHHPGERARFLRIPECAFNRYETCFLKLNNTKYPPKLSPRIYYAPISTKQTRVDETNIELQLDTVRWPIVAGSTGWRPIDQYRIHIPIIACSERRRDGLIADINAFRNRQDLFSTQNIPNRMHAFFLGIQDPVDLMLFRISDIRLIYICEITDPQQV